MSLIFRSHRISKCFIKYEKFTVNCTLSLAVAEFDNLAPGNTLKNIPQ